MIRTAEMKDIGMIRALFESEPGFWNPAWNEETLRKGLQAAGDLAIVWEEDGQLLGFICAHDLGFRAYLSELIVAGKARGKGIGSELVKAVEMELIQRGCSVIIADVWRDAASFYQSMGWSAPDALLLRKRLDQPAQKTD